MSSVARDRLGTQGRRQSTGVRHRPCNRWGTIASSDTPDSARPQEGNTASDTDPREPVEIRHLRSVMAVPFWGDPSELGATNDRSPLGD
jgi:hypothetical protein